MIKLSSAEKVIAAFLLFVATLLVFRIMYANNLHYAFLLWNLFLAWIPFQLSVFLTTTQLKNRLFKYFFLSGWLLFFPNALYIITDLIHLEHSRADIPVWFDAVLLFASSVAGLIMAFISLYQVEMYLRKNMKSKHVKKFVIASLFAGSFGVYLGRFLRWNSWDIITNPLSLLMQIAHQMFMPLQHYRTWAVTIVFTGLFALLYFTIKKLPGILEHPDRWTDD
jgi:uncharacterized membrane protein